MNTGGIKLVLPHIIPTIKQRCRGVLIGERGTPVVSVWPMRDKWLKYQRVFDYLGRDGDWEMRDGRLREPPEIQLVYIKFRNKVIQLAYMTGRIAA